MLWTCILRASPRRAWLTLSLMVETALRRPRALRDAVTLRAHAQAPVRVHARHCLQLDELGRVIIIVRSESRAVFPAGAIEAADIIVSDRDRNVSRVRRG